MERYKLKVKIGKDIVDKIKGDHELYYAFQSNIAMAFVDEYERCEKKYKNRVDIQQIANWAAKNFLDSWANR